MSIALQRTNSNSVHLSNCMQRASIYESAEAKAVMDERREGEREDDVKSGSSSSIGKNSDASPDAEEASEVQSSFGGNLGRLDAIEDAPPVRRGISKFYGGKSKSFTSLADASSILSMKDLEKPENPYNKKRKSLIRQSTLWDRKRNHHFVTDGSGMYKKPANFGRSTFFIEVTVNSSEMMNNEDLNSISSSGSRHLPPLHPQVKRSAANVSSSSPTQLNSPWRSFSMSDLQSIAASSPNVTGLAIHGGDMDGK